MNDVINDRFVLRDMERELRDALVQALLRCAVHARRLNVVDPDQLMADLRCEFDPNLETSCIQDCFSDGFHEAGKQTNDDALIAMGGRPLRPVPSLEAAE